MDLLCEAYHSYSSWKILRDYSAKKVQQQLSKRWFTPTIPPLSWSKAQCQFNWWISTLEHTSDVRLAIMNFRIAARDPTAPGVTIFPPNLAGLLLRFRDRKATDARDLVYAYMGMAASGTYGTEIAVDYHLSKECLYTKIAHALLRDVLNVLLWVESPDRPIEKTRSGLPSWVPDYTTQQLIFSRLQINLLSDFAAHLDFPLVALEPRLRDEASDILVLRGICIGVITKIRDLKLTDIVAYKGRDTIKFIKYTEDASMRYGKPVASPSPYRGISALAFFRALLIIILRILYFIISRILYPTISRLIQPFYFRSRFLRRVYHVCNQGSATRWKSTGWGPCHAAVGDIIIVAAGCRIPLVIRPIDDGQYLFVGACWLIDWALKMELVLNHEAKDAGFSPIMFGSACKDLPENWEAEEFSLC